MVLFKKKQKSKEDYYLASQWTLMARKLRKHKLAQVSLFVLLILYVCALFADFLAPYGLEEFDALYKNSAPTKIHLEYEGENVGPHIYKLQIEKVAMFNAMFSEYELNPEMTKSRMYYEAISEILPGVKLYINTSDGDVQMLLPLESLMGGN